MKSAIAFALLCTVSYCFAQSPESQPSFDVVSIKPSPPGAREALNIQPGRLVANGLSLQLLTALAWHLQKDQMPAGKGWIADDKWSIEATAPDVTDIPRWAPPDIPEVIAARLRTLLTDRFHLITHRESRETAVYLLNVAKGGSRVAAVDPASPPAGVRMGPGVIDGSALTMSMLVTLLNRVMDRPVIDKSGLTGMYKLRLEFAPESTAGVDSTKPSIFTAVQEQLGLKLEPAKVPVEVLVIDSVEKPAEN